MLASGEAKSLRAACRLLKIDASDALLWVRSDMTLSLQYTKAREVGYLVLADELEDLATEAKDEAKAAMVLNLPAGPLINAYRLQVDTRKWLLSKVLPKVFADRVTHAGDADAPITIRVVREA